MKPKARPYSEHYKNAELAKIHIAKKDLGMDDDTYRAMLRQVAGVESSKDLTAIGRAKVLDYLKTHGFNAKKHIGKKPNNLDGASTRASQLRKIEALLADSGRPWDYALTLAAHMYKKDALEFCDSTELRGMIAALEKDKARRNKRAATTKQAN